MSIPWLDLKPPGPNVWFHWTLKGEKSDIQKYKILSEAIIKKQLFLMKKFHRGGEGPTRFHTSILFTKSSKK